ncbi:MAG: P-loop NTPase [Spirochaetales bacterium]|nr:P-loop NTPase [Spirochaetales bacterium]
MQTTIAISSGKGGTGKTFIATNIARVLEKSGRAVRYLDCDVEEPNGHLFLKPAIDKREDVMLLSPHEVDETKCDACGECVKACQYSALALIKKSVLVFKNLCHACGACSIVCPHNAIIKKERKIGEMLSGNSGSIDFHYALLETGEGGMTPRLIKKVKGYIGDGINILDSPPGTSCPVVETVKDAGLCVLVTDPTPFGINDLKLAVDMCRELGKEPAILVNRAEYSDNSLKNYCRDKGLKIIGEIPDERRIAECYSTGDLVVDRFPDLNDVFMKLADNILKEAMSERVVKQKILKPQVKSNPGTEKNPKTATESNPANGRELVVISGKGGTGKTSLVAAFCALEKNIAISDCDVDAADLHLVLNPEILEKGDFSGGKIASIDPEKCTSCGACLEACRFDAVREMEINDATTYGVEAVSCEGCAVCRLVCRFDAVTLKTVVNGEWFSSQTRFGPMSHAKLGIAEENSGKLVTLIRNKKNEMASRHGLQLSIIDGSPGTGCPVIASVVGSDYALVVTEPTVSGVHDLKRILDVIRFFKIKSGIIVNKADLNSGKTAEIREIAGQSGSDFIGEIPFDKSFTRAQMEKLSVIEYAHSPLTEKITAIWQIVRERVFQDNG